jgi:hypothetical protein
MDIKLLCILGGFMKKIGLFFIALCIGQIQAADQDQTVWKRLVTRAQSTIKHAQKKARTFWSPRKTKIAAGLVTVAGGTGIVSIGYYLLHRKSIIHNSLSYDDTTDVPHTSVETQPISDVDSKNNKGDSLKSEDTIRINESMDQQKDAVDNTSSVDDSTMVRQNGSFGGTLKKNTASKENGNMLSNIWHDVKRTPKQIKKTLGNKVPKFGLKAAKPKKDDVLDTLVEKKDEAMTKKLTNLLEEKGITNAENLVAVTSCDNDFSERKNGITIHIINNDNYASIITELKKWASTIDRGESICIRQHVRGQKMNSIDWNKYHYEQTLALANGGKPTEISRSVSNASVQEEQNSLENAVWQTDQILTNSVPDGLQNHWQVLETTTNDGKTYFMIQVFQKSLDGGTQITQDNFMQNYLPKVKIL